jgi:predicted permease
MLIEDLRTALRSLWRRPGFLVLGALGLGLGLGGVALVVAVLNTFVLRPVPGIHAPTPLVEIGRISRGGGFDSFSFPDFVDVRERVAALDRVYAHSTTLAYLQRDSEVAPAMARLVSGNYFDALGVRSAHGQLLGPQHDAVAGGSPVVVLGHSAFERWFDSDASRIGSEISINGSSYTLIGVVDAQFRGHEAVIEPDIYVPLAMAQSMNLHPDSIRSSRGSRWLHLGGRLAADASLTQVQAELSGLAHSLAETFPDSNSEVQFDAALLRATPREATQIVGLIAAALLTLCMAVLALACVNLAGVMLARGETRRAELAMRSVLGAGRARLARQLFLEALVVGLAAAAVALATAWLGRDVLNALPLPFPLPLDLSLAIDLPVVLSTLGVALIVSVAFGLLPALRISAHAPGRGGSLGEAGSGKISRQRGRHMLLAVQAGLTVALLATAGLVIRSVQEAAAVDTGMRTEGVFLADLDLEPLGLAGEIGSESIEAVATRLREIPGIHGAGFASVVPLTLSSLGYGAARLPGQDTRGIRLDVNTVGEGFLDTLGIAVRGRPILASDTSSVERVAVLNASVARALFGEQDPLGQVFELGSRDEWQPIRVVGIAPDGRYSTLSDAGKSFAYLAAPQWERSEFTLFLHSSIEIGALQEALKDVVANRLPGLPPPRLQRFSDVAQLSVLPQTVLAGAASLLGLLALVLAATGLYGVMAYQVASRTREFGVRKALGAAPARIVSTLLRPSLTWLLPGALLGLLLGQGAALLFGSALFGVRPFDPAASVGVLALFLCMLLLAAALPTARALRLGPSEALRHD